MEQDWEEFDEGPRQTVSRLYVSMNPLGEIVMNRRTFDEIKRPEAVVLLFNSKTCSIGVRPASPLMPNAFELKTKGTCQHRVIRAKPFLAKHDIRIDNTVRFSNVTIEGDILALRKLINVSRGPKNRRRR